MEVREGPLGPEVEVPGGFKGARAGVVAALAPLPACYGVFLGWEGASTGDPWRMAVGAAVLVSGAYFMARPLGQALGFVSERIQRHGDRLVLIDVLPGRRVIPLSDVVDVVYDFQWRQKPGKAGSLTLADAKDPLAPEQGVPAGPDATLGRGVRLKLRNGEEISVGRGLDAPGSRRLMAVLRERFGLPVRPD